MLECICTYERILDALDLSFVDVAFLVIYYYFNFHNVIGRNNLWIFTIAVMLHTTCLHWLHARALFLGRIMAVDSALQPPCESHASAAHVVSSAPVLWLVRRSGRSLVGVICADSCGGTRASHAVLAEHQWAEEVMRTENNILQQPQRQFNMQ